MDLEAGVALVAGGHVHDVALHVGGRRGGAGGGHEVIGDVGRSQDGHAGDAAVGAVGRVGAGAAGVAADLDGHAVDQVRLVAHVAEVLADLVLRGVVGVAVQEGLGGGDVPVEGVGVGAVTVVHQGARVVGAGLGGGRGGGGGGHRGHDVAHPLAGAAADAGHELRDGEAEVAVGRHQRARGLAGEAQAADGGALAVSDGEVHHWLGAHGHAGDAAVEGQLAPLVGGELGGIHGDDGVGAIGSVGAIGTVGAVGAVRASGARLAVAADQHQGDGGRGDGAAELFQGSVLHAAFSLERVGLRLGKARVGSRMG